MQSIKPRIYFIKLYMAKFFHFMCLRMDSGTSFRYRIKCGFIWELLYIITL